MCFMFGETTVKQLVMGYPIFCCYLRYQKKKTAATHGTVLRGKITTI